MCLEKLVNFCFLANSGRKVTSLLSEQNLFFYSTRRKELLLLAEI